MSARSNSYKHYPHIFTPMQMLYNYTSNIKSTIGEFFRQYLKPQGRQILLLFNRYMLIAIFINIDLIFLLALSVLVYIVIKLVKVRPWNKERHANLPLSYVNALYDLRGRSSIKDQQRNIQKDLQEVCSPSVSEKSNSFNESGRMPILCVQQKQKMLKQVNEPEIGYFTSSQIEHFIYKTINTMIEGYCRFLWYAKWNSIGVLWLIAGLIYLFEPSNQYDTFKLKTKKDGALIIGEIKKASEIINYFQLIFICLLANAILFYYYGTRQLKNELLLQVYTREYTINMIKNRRLRTVKSSMNSVNIHFAKNTFRESPDSPLLFRTVVDSSQMPDFEQIKPYGSTEKKSSPKIEVPEGFSERKFSYDVHTVSAETPPKKLIDPSNQQIESMLERSMVYSEDEYQELQQTNQAHLTHYDTKGSLPEHKDVKKNPKIQNRGNFLSKGNSQNLITSNNRKTSDEYKTHQIYNDFKISLLKVQQVSKANRSKQ